MFYLSHCWKDGKTRTDRRVQRVTNTSPAPAFQLVSLQQDISCVAPGESRSKTNIKSTNLTYLHLKLRLFDKQNSEHQDNSITLKQNTRLTYITAVIAWYGNTSRIKLYCHCRNKVTIVLYSGYRHIACTFMFGCCSYLLILQYICYYMTFNILWYQ